MLEGCILTHHCLHAANSRRELRVLDVQFQVGGKLSAVTVQAQIIWPHDLGWPHGGEHRFGAQFAVVRLLAAGTRNRTLVRSRDGETQQFGQRAGPRLMQGRAHRHFDGFQIQPPALTAAAEDHAQKLVYFARDFLADRFDRFFSWGESVSSTGRAWQTCALTSINPRLNS